MEFKDSCHMRCHVLAYDSEAGGRDRDTARCNVRQPKGRYESTVLVLFSCILLVVTIVNIMDYLAT